MRVFAIDFDFLAELALEVVFFQKLGDLLVARWLLLAELVAREGEDAKTFFLVGILKNMTESELEVREGYLLTREGIEVLCIQSRSRLISTQH